MYIYNAGRIATGSLLAHDKSLRMHCMSPILSTFSETQERGAYFFTDTTCICYQSITGGTLTFKVIS